MKYKNILWDWNGTLIDDVGVALEAVNIMLERRSLPKINIGQYYSYVDTPIIRFYEKCFDMTKDDEGTLLPEYQRLYAELAQELPKNDTTYKTVKALQDKRFRQFIVSSCEQNILNNWLARYGITHFFEAVTGADNLCAESKTERAIHLMGNYGLEPSETVLWVIRRMISTRQRRSELMRFWSHTDISRRRKTETPGVSLPIRSMRCWQF